MYFSRAIFKSFLDNSKRIKLSRPMVTEMTKTKGENHLVWIDLEMTGLNENVDQILEISCLITDEKLNIVAEGPDIIIHQEDKVLDSMDDWCVKHHGESGLTEACRKSKISLKEAETTVLKFISSNVPKKSCCLAGNSVYCDRIFIRKYMPQVDDYLHYRIVDVSSLKELCRRWNPELYKNAPPKKFAHRSLDDIKESIQELRYYREHFCNVKH